MSDTTVTTLDDAPEVEAKAAATKATAKSSKASAAAKEAGLAGTTKSITIHPGEGTAGREDVFIAVNGYAFNIKRGKPVEVPAEVVDVLKNAVTTQYENGEAIEQPRYAFSVHN